MTTAPTAKPRDDGAPRRAILHRLAALGRESKPLRQNWRPRGHRPGCSAPGQTGMIPARRRFAHQAAFSGGTMTQVVPRLPQAPKSVPMLPPLENGDHLDQPTFHARYEAMPSGTRAQLIGGIVYMGSPL